MSSCCRPQTESPGKRGEARSGPGLLPLIYSDSGDQTGQVVFAGWGIHAPELNYDDYAGIEVKDRFVLCFRGTPDPSDPRFQESDEHRTRMKIARQQGALGLIYIYDEAHRKSQRKLDSWIHASGHQPEDCRPDFQERDLQASSLRADLQKYKRPISFPTRARVRLTVQSVHVADGTGYNVVGVIEGDDPTVKSEYVVVGGTRPLRLPGRTAVSGRQRQRQRDRCGHGIAKALASNAKKPRRSSSSPLRRRGIRAQRIGILRRHLPPRLGKPVAMLNFDMVGEGDGTRASFSHDRPELDTLLAQADAGVKILRGTSPMRRVGVQGSDFAPFFAMGILAFHSPRTGRTFSTIRAAILSIASIRTSWPTRPASVTSLLCCWPINEQAGITPQDSVVGCNFLEAPASWFVRRPEGRPVRL